MAVECLQKIALINKLRIELIHILSGYYMNQFRSVDNYESVVHHTSNTHRNQAHFNHLRQQLIKKFVIENKLIELQSDYYGMDSYYYSKKKNTMYKVCNICDYSNNVNPNFEISRDQHIITLNNLNSLI